jgi:protein-disulfide isomerase-like protein with CxxC motif
MCVCDWGGNSAMSTTAFLDDNARMLADLQAVQRERYQQGRDALSPIEKTVGMVIPVL